MYKIAGLYVDMVPKYKKTQIQSEDYKTNEADTANIKIHLPDEFLNKCHDDNPHLSLEDCEYIWTGCEFYEILPEFSGFFLHSSAVVYDNEAFLFSAPCGTGKSTHTQIWLKRFEGAYILNDDKPAIRLKDGKFYVYGTPFSGKTDLNVNAEVPLKGICVLERGSTNEIERMSSTESLFAILNQTVRPRDESRMDKLLRLIDRLIEDIPIYKLRCNMELEAAEVSYCGMTGKKI